jgi:hypothetical protein
VSFNDLMQKFSGSSSGPLELPPESKNGSLDSFVQRFSNVSEEYPFYNGEVVLRFDKDAHQYYRVAELGNLMPVAGVTTVLRVIDRSNALVPWASKMCAEKMLRLMPLEGVGDAQRTKALTLAEFTTLVMEAKSAHKDRLESAGNIGTMAHDWLELYIKAVLAKDTATQSTMLTKKCDDERATNCVNSALDWIRVHNVRYRDTERKVYSRRYDYAGTLDGLALVDSCNDKACCPETFKDRLSLIDYKTSNHLHLEYMLQTAAYCQAYTEEHSVDIEDRWVLRLGKEAGDLEVWHATPESLQEDLSGFLTCQTLCAIVESVEERIKKQHNNIKAIRKAQRLAEKELKKEQEKLRKALEKAEAKRLKQIGKEKTKAEAKAKRELAKKKEKLEKAKQNISVCEAVQPVPAQSTEVSAEVDLGMILSPLEELECTSTSSPSPETILLGTITHKENLSLSLHTANPKKQPSESITLTEELTSASSTPKQNLLQYEEEPEYKPIALPQES